MIIGSILLFLFILAFVFLVVIVYFKHKKNQRIENDRVVTSFSNPVYMSEIQRQQNEIDNDADYLELDNADAEEQSYNM